MPTLYKEDGTVEPLVPKCGPHFGLEELQAVVGGYIEVVPHATSDRLVLVVNEEGRLKGMAPNLKASLVAGRPIVGPAVVCHRKRLN